MLNLERILQAVAGRPDRPIEDLPVSGISTDSRAVKRGELFFAVKGESFDGHDFVADAFRRGALAAVVSRAVDAPGPCLVVEDPVRALADLAAAWRMAIPAKVVGVAGSNGKTTTKDMIAHVLGKDRRVVKAQGSYNNHVGVPLTLFQADERTEVVVAEVGTNHPGEMAALGRVARPDVAVLVSVGAEHLEGLGSIEGVIAEELSFLNWLRAGGRAVVHDDPRILGRLRLVPEKVVTFGRWEGSDFRADDVTADLRFRVGEVAFKLPLLGEWNVQNALAATAACAQLGVPVEDCARRLEDFRGPKMRMERLELAGVVLINDAYNSNPESALRAVREFSRFPSRGRRVAVVGDMRELGAHAERYHRELGCALSESAVDVVVAVGNEACTVTSAVGPGKEIHRFKSVEELRPHLGDLVREGDAVLLKGSRALGLERVVKWMGERVA